MLPQLRKIAGAALDFLFPQKCLGCGKEGALVCHACEKRLTRIVNPICPRCGRPQASPILCPTCIELRSSLTCIRSPLRFEGLTRQIIHQFKYQNLRSLTLPLAEILKNYLRHEPLPVEIVIPVPLHPRRLKERGYNQSQLLARELSRLMNLPLVDNELKRVKYIVPQTRTRSVQERRENLKEAFQCRNLSQPGKAILLLDDVTTSGATLDAGAKALLTAGSGPVFGLTLAREI